MCPVFQVKENEMTLDYRNWPVIARVDDFGVRRFFMTLKHPYLVEGCRVSSQFSHYFHEDGPQEFCFPRSRVIAEEVAEIMQGGGEVAEVDAREDATYYWNDGVNRLEIPKLCFHWWRSPGSDHIGFPPSFFVRIPPELECQLQCVDLERAAGRVVMLDGVEMVVVGGDSSEQCVWVARADHIDLDN